MRPIDSALLRAFTVAGFSAVALITVLAGVAGERGLLLRAISAGLISLLALIRLRRAQSVGPVLLASVAVIVVHVLQSRSASTFVNGMFGVVGLGIAAVMLIDNLSRVVAAVSSALIIITGARIAALDEPVTEPLLTGLAALLVVWFGGFVIAWAKREIGGTETRYRNLFSRSPIATWEEDFRGLAAWLAGLRAAGITDIRDYFEKFPDELVRAASLIEVLDVNDAAVRFVGASSREGLLGPLEPGAIIAGTFDALLEEIVAVWEGRASMKVDLHGHVGSGLINGYLLMSAPRTSAGIDWGRVIVVMVDVSDQLMAQRRLEELIDAKDQFVASISHELRTPLTAVVGLAEELHKGGVRFSDAERDDLLALIADQATDVGYIVEDLLVAARADMGSVTVSTQLLDVAEEIAHIAASSRGLAQATVDVAAGLAVKADRQRFRQIVRNLLTNAARYGGSHVEVVARRRGGACSIEVRDDGPGIPPSLADAIFEPYGVAHRQEGVTESVGLGLTVSRQLARLMEGDVSYRRDRGITVFELVLPAG